MPDKFDYYKRWEYVSFLREFTKRGQKQSSTESQQLHFASNSRRKYNTIPWERFITSVQTPPNLLFLKKENSKDRVQAKWGSSFFSGKGTLISISIQQRVQELFSSFTCYQCHSGSNTFQQGKKVIVHFMLFFQFVRLPNHLSQMHSRASSGETIHRPFLVKEKNKVLTWC